LMFISIDIFFWMDNDGVEDIVDKVKVMGWFFLMLYLISRSERCSFMWFFSKKKIKEARVWMVIWVYLFYMHFGLLEKKTTSHNFH
jgi:hypothetical protein